MSTTNGIVRFAALAILPLSLLLGLGACAEAKDAMEKGGLESAQKLVDDIDSTMKEKAEGAEGPLKAAMEALKEPKQKLMDAIKAAKDATGDKKDEAMKKVTELVKPLMEQFNKVKDMMSK